MSSTESTHRTTIEEKFNFNELVPLNSTASEVKLEKVIEIITYACSGVSIASILLTLLSYIGYRKFNVKRPHIIMVNLCISLLVYFVSYAISNPSRHLVVDVNSANYSIDLLCILGAFFCHLSLLSVWLWLTAYWFILLIMYRKPMGGHVSHFVFKSSIPCYGIPICFAVVGIIVAYFAGDIKFSGDLGYATNACFVGNYYLYFGLILPFTISTIPVVVIFVSVIRGLYHAKSEKSTQLQQKLNELHRVKSHLIRLSVITFLTALLILDSAIIPVVKRMNHKGKIFSLVILFSAVSIGLGVLLLYLFCIRQKDIRDYWIEMVLGSKSSLRNRSFTHNIGSLKKRRSLGRKDSYRMHNNEDEIKRPGYKIVAKQDTDLTSLNIDQIPGTPNPPSQRKSVKTLNGSIRSAGSVRGFTGIIRKKSSKSRESMTSPKPHLLRTLSSTSGVQVTIKDEMKPDYQTTPRSIKQRSVSSSEETSTGRKRATKSPPKFPISRSSLSSRDSVLEVTNFE